VAKALALLLLASCIKYVPGDGKTECVTRCGVVLRAPTPPPNPDRDDEPRWNCENLQTAEDRVLGLWASDIVKDTSRTHELKTNGCFRIRGQMIFIRKEPQFIDRWGRQVAGYADCGLSTIVLGNKPIFNSGLYHELTHAAQKCDGYHGDDHYKWCEEGLGACEDGSDTVSAEGAWHNNARWRL